MYHAIDLLRSHAIALPVLAKFALAMAILVCLPRFASRLRLPTVVVLLITGIIIGPHGLDVIGTNRPIVDFFAEIGKLLLMFCAGLEIELGLFHQARNRVVIFGLLTTSLPLLLGAGVGVLFGDRPVAAVVLGSLLASHTLIAAPIVARFHANRLEPLAVTYGATIMSDTLSLVVFAVCVSTFQRGFSAPALALQLLEIGIFVPLLPIVVSRAGAYVLAKLANDQTAYFAMMLATMAVSAVAADLIHLPGIVGAFLAGLSVNAAVHSRPATETDDAAIEKLKFVGDSLFVPSFFLAIGFLIDPRKFYHSVTGDLGVVSAVIAALLAGKWMAAEIAGLAFGYSRTSRLTVWSLTLPQVAATLAATLVAYQTFDPSGQRLIGEQLVNVVLVLVLVTSILGPVLTEHFLRRLLPDVAAPAKAA